MGANPFHEQPHRISSYTAQEIATLSSRLEKRLGPEYLSARPGAGGQKLLYVPGDKCVNLANEIFGFNGWSSTIKDIQIDFVDETSNGRVSLGISVVVRVTLKDGTYHEGIGYGHIENCKCKGSAFEKAKKEGTTDGLKRALRQFGNVLGNCILDKEYLARISKIKAVPTKWGVEDLHRPPNFAPIPKESLPEPQQINDLDFSTGTEFDDEFGGEDFDEVDFSESHITNGEINPDEIASDISRPNHSVPNGGVNGHMAQPQHNVNGQRNAINNKPQGDRTQNSAAAAAAQQRPLPQQPRPVPPARPHSAQVPRTPGNESRNNHAAPNPPNVDAPGPQTNTAGRIPDPPAGAPLVGFVSAHAAPILQDSPSILPTHTPAAFNPHTESPSIRKTSGVDHSKSKPVNRDLIESASTTTAATTTTNGATAPRTTAQPPTNFANPHLDNARKIGVPNAYQNPMAANRGTYKPPGPAAAGGVKRGPDGQAVASATARAPLNDVSVNKPLDGTGDVDAKRPRLAGP
ncbi:MAG: DNA repair protein rad52 [Piccolia ochrophora]|nr:MAG: DNA repair protein rad52 [Piccolia ochrophora]